MHSFSGSGRLSRHALVWVSRHSYPGIAAQIADIEIQTAVAEWLSHGWPLVVRTQTPLSASSGGAPSIALGVPLPPVEGRYRRIALGVPPTAIERAASPWLLTDSVARLPAPWREPLESLSLAAQALELELRVFGSVAWEAITGQSYLRENSDIDLVCEPRSSAQWRQALSFFCASESRLGVRIDAELWLREADGTELAMAWRECYRCEQDLHPKPDDLRQVLAKTLRGPRLLDFVALCSLVDGLSASGHGPVCV